MNLPTVILLIFCGVVALITVIYMFISVRKRSYLSSIYNNSARDYRFAYALMRLYFKKAVMRCVYLLKTNDGISPRADVVAVLKGGIVVITVLDGKGFFSTPAEGSWYLTDDNNITTEIPNSLKLGKRYVSELDSLLVRSGIPSQNIYNIVLLSDDKATFDELHSDNILTGDMLIPVCKKLCNAPIMNGRTQKSIISAIMRHHKNCKSYADRNIYNTLSFSSKEPSLPSFSTEFDKPEIPVSTPDNDNDDENND